MLQSKFRQLYQEKGAALVIVLAFLVLLTGLVVAYFSRSLTSRQLANTSFNQTKAGQLALSASDLVIGDLKQEIVNGSSPTPTPGIALYVPTINTNMVPQRSGTPAAGETPIPNLVRRSIRSDAIVAPGIPSRASAVNSETDASVTGRNISLDRWNKHYLAPKLTTGNDSTTPVTSFKAPDWVIVTNNGPQKFDAWDATLKDSTNANYAVGRYAYAIYDEGGLIDINAVGFPSPTPAGTPYQNYKSSLGMVNLNKVATTSSSTVTDAQVDKLIGWRNYATAQPSGAFNAFVFDATATGRYIAAVLGRTDGFRKVSTTTFNNRTDQVFATRQQMIAYKSPTGFSVNAFQYLTHFSRALDQPSFIPDPNRPKVVSAAVASTPNTVLSTFRGGNDAFGNDDAINPSFLTIRVGTSFTRLDGSTAKVGEPLVKRRFALSNLSRITPTATATNTSTDPIYSRFGIYRANASTPWIYDHGGTNRILRLSEVQAANREPDFAELLKAAINCGSLAKAAPNGDSTGVYAYVRDSSVDLQVLQVMANIIDQYDTDSFPTIMQMGAAATASGKIAGIEDLPYLYRFRPFVVVKQNPSPMLTHKDYVVLHDQAFTYNNGTGNATGDATVVRTQYAPGGLLSSNAGEAALLYIPEVWNPHDANTRLVSSTNRPTRFRVTLSSADPNGTSTSTIGGKLYKRDNATGSNYTYQSPTPSPTPSNLTPPTYPTNVPSPSPTPRVLLTRDNSAIEFTDASGALMREPTMLWRPNAPTGSNVVPGSASQFSARYGTSLTDVNTTQQYVGILASYGPVSWTDTVTCNPDGASSVDRNGTPTVVPPGTQTYIFQGTNLGPVNFTNVTFRMEYYDTNSSTWIPYDEKYINTHNVGDPSIVVNVKDSSGNNYDWNIPKDSNGSTNVTKPTDKNPFANNSLELAGTSYDPRTNRFCMSSSDINYPAFTQPGLADNLSDPLLEVNAGGDTVATNTTMGSTTWTTAKTQRPAIAQPTPLPVPTAPPKTATAAVQGQNNNFSAPGSGGSPNNAFTPVSLIRWFSGYNYYNGQAGTTDQNSTYFLGGILSQNNPKMKALARDGLTALQFFYEDPDGVARRGMSAYVPLDTNNSTSSLVGIPLIAAGDGTGTVTTQSQSRPIILNRAFRSVADLGYAFRGTQWKQIDFSTPESGDTALLDVFTLNEPPSDAVVAGKVNLNTRQIPVLKALLAGAYRDEFANLATPPAGALPVVAPSPSSTEATNIATCLVNTTTGTQGWQGPLTNIGDIVGHYVSASVNPGSASDSYQYVRPVTTGGPPTATYTYGGLSGSLGANPSPTPTQSPTPNPVWDSANLASSAQIQRFRESAIRPLADCGQTRTWNLLIDVVAQSGRYSSNASALPNFFVEGEKRYWVHVAIDRLTGEVIDKQVEPVTE
ncbi:MAG: hypothetical protein H0X40_00485 [Chthoniobacterales bacterium]|nr:hypothetical protein [Chthoniobacterales bacterium]